VKYEEGKDFEKLEGLLFFRVEEETIEDVVDNGQEIGKSEIPADRGEKVPMLPDANRRLRIRKNRK
jgi:hypothetical protein